MRLTEALCSGLCVCVGSPCASSSSPCCLGQGWSPTQGSLKLLSFQQPIPCWGSGLARLLEDRLGLFVGTWLEIPADSCCLQVVRKRHFSIWWFCWIAAPNFILFYFLKILFDVANLSKYKLLLAERKNQPWRLSGCLFLRREGDCAAVNGFISHPSQYFMTKNRQRNRLLQIILFLSVQALW